MKKQLKITSYVVYITSNRPMDEMKYMYGTATTKIYVQNKIVATRPFFEAIENFSDGSQRRPKCN